MEKIVPPSWVQRCAECSGGWWLGWGFAWRCCGGFVARRATAGPTLHWRCCDSLEAIGIVSGDARLHCAAGLTFGGAEGGVTLSVAGDCEPPPCFAACCWTCFDRAGERATIGNEDKRFGHVISSSDPKDNHRLGGTCIAFEQITSAISPTP